MKEYHGCWPTMITPYTETGAVDYPAVRALVQWYIDHGADGIFAVCQSSEMFFLEEQEKMDIARAVVDAAAGRIKVIASGHTANDHGQQVQQLGAMWETGVDAVVMVSNRFAKADEGEDVFESSIKDIFRQLPDVQFGMYECPYPYRRLLTTSFLREAAENKSLVFLKDVCCSLPILRERIDAIAGTSLSLFNANTSTFLPALQMGADGYNGVMANFHLDLYKWVYEHFKTEPGLASEVADFLTVAAVMEARAYPVSAKYYQNMRGVPMTINCRSKSKDLLNENAIHEIEALARLEDLVRGKLFR